MQPSKAKAHITRESSASKSPNEIQKLRCFMRRDNAPDRKRKAKPLDAPDAALWPWGGPCLSFFTVPCLDPKAGLRARIGFWRYHGIGKETRIKRYGEFNRGEISFEQFRSFADTPFGTGGTIAQLSSDWAAKNGGFASGKISEGVFYNPEFCSEEEIAEIVKFAKQNNLGCADLKGFVHCVLYKSHQVKGGATTAWEPKLICGQDLSNELSAISSGFVKTKDGKGFTLEFCDCKEAMARGEKRKCNRHMKVGIKPLANGHMFSPLSGFRLNRFLDISQVNEVLGIGNSPPDISPELTVCKNSLDHWRDCGTKIFEAYKNVRDKYREYNLETNISNLYSGASIAKATIRAFNIVPFLKQNPDFDPNILGKFQSANLGARTETKLTAKTAEVSHLDFSSQYPSVFSIMGLQEILIADRVEAVVNSPPDKEFLKSLDFKSLFEKKTWAGLRGIALIRPSGCVLTLGVGENLESAKIASGPPIWVTFADVAASIILTGQVPEILETISLVPHGVQRGVTQHDLFGKPDYRIDPRKDDLFVKMSAIRSGAKATGQSGVADAIKIVMNSGAFGIFGEVNLDCRKTSEPFTVYCAGQSIRLKSNRRGHGGTIPIEDPGEFFSPLAPLAISGGRLLLAMLERAGANLGLDYAECDTDAMIFVRPSGLPRADFVRRIQDICGQFEPLSPYGGSKPFLKIEDRCFSLRSPGKPQPLYFLGLGFKAYAEFNLNRNGAPVIRHIAVIGLGDIREPPGYDPEAHEFTAGNHSAGCGSDVCDATASRLIMDLWRHAIRRYSQNKQGLIDGDLKKIAALKKPAFTALDPSTQFDCDLYSNIPGFRPFMPLLRVPHLYDVPGYAVTGAPAWDGSFSYLKDKKNLLERETGQTIARPGMRALSERLTGYFSERLTGYFNADDGEPRRTVHIGQQFVVPKGERAIKVEDRDMQAEPELKALNFNATFKLTPNGLIPPRDTAGTSSNIFQKLEKRGLLGKFIETLAMPKDTFALPDYLMDFDEEYLSGIAELSSLGSSENLIERASSFFPVVKHASNGGKARAIETARKMTAIACEAVNRIAENEKIPATRALEIYRDHQTAMRLLRQNQRKDSPKWRIFLAPEGGPPANAPDLLIQAFGPDIFAFLRADTAQDRQAVIATIQETASAAKRRKSKESMAKLRHSRSAPFAQGLEPASLHGQ